MEVRPIQTLNLLDLPVGLLDSRLRRGLSLSCRAAEGGASSNALLLHGCSQIKDLGFVRVSAGSHQAHALVAWYPEQYGPLLTPDAPPLATPATPLRRGKSLALSEATTPIKPARATPASQQKAASKQEPANGAASPAATAGAHSAATPPRQADVPDAQSSFATAADAPPPPRSPPGLPAAEAARAPAPVRHASMASAAPEDKWWLDNDDPLYFVMTPSSITLGRPCDADDQVRRALRRVHMIRSLVFGSGGFVEAVRTVRCPGGFGNITRNVGA